MTTTDHTIVAPAVTGDPGTRNDAGGFDPALFGKAVAIVTGSQNARCSCLQRSLSISYNKAADLIERMEVQGIVSAPDDHGRRVILSAAPDPIPQPEGDAPPAPAQSAGAAADGYAQPEALHAFASFVWWQCMQGLDIDGGAAQNEAERLGLLTSFSYDPKKHGESDAEPGEEIFCLKPLAGRGGAAADGEDDAAGVTQADIDHAQALLDDRRGTHQTLTMVRHMLDFALTRRGARPHEPADASARSARGEVAEAVLAEREAGLQIVGDEIARLHRSFGDPDSEPNRYACEAAIYCLTNVRQAIRARPTPAAVLDRARPAGQGEGEPVAWQWRVPKEYGEGGWRTVMRREVAEANAAHYGGQAEVRPLYAAPPSAAAAPPAPASRATSAPAQDAGPAGVTEALAAALIDMQAGWRYIRKHHGDLSGVGWDRCEASASAALDAAARARTLDAGKETGR